MSRRRDEEDLRTIDKKYIFDFLNLPACHKDEIDFFANHLRINPRVEMYFERLRLIYPDITIGHEVFTGQRLYQLLLNVAVFKKVSALEVATDEALQYLTCYNEFGIPIIKLEKIFVQGTYVKLFRGRFLDEQYAATNYNWDYRKPIVVKLHQSKDGVNDTSFEIGVYRCLGDPRPSLGVNCYLWNVPVLVMEPLQKIDHTDDENKIGIQVLKQLEKIHQKTVMSDIKPDNIMKVPKVPTASKMAMASRDPRLAGAIMSGYPTAMLDYNRREPTYSSYPEYGAGYSSIHPDPYAGMNLAGYRQQQQQQYGAPYPSYSDPQVPQGPQGPQVPQGTYGAYGMADQTVSAYGAIGAQISPSFINPYAASAATAAHSAQDEEDIYIAMDLGGCPRETLGHGFRRRTWSSRWTDQRRGTLMTPKDDLKELAHTLVGQKFVRIEFARSGKRVRYPSAAQRKFTGRLKVFYDYIMSIDDVNTPHFGYTEHYAKLASILKGEHIHHPPPAVGDTAAEHKVHSTAAHGHRPSSVNHHAVKTGHTRHVGHTDRDRRGIASALAEVKAAGTTTYTGGGTTVVSSPISIRLPGAAVPFPGTQFRQHTEVISSLSKAEEKTKHRDQRSARDPSKDRPPPSVRSHATKGHGTASNHRIPRPNIPQ
jgi:hypothetical protein